MNNFFGDDRERQCRSASRFCRCSAKVIAFLAFLLAGTLGLILGAVLSAPLLAALPALILGAVTLAVLIIVTFIYRSCAGCGCRSDE